MMSFTGPRLAIAAALLLLVSFCMSAKALNGQLHHHRGLPSSYGHRSRDVKLKRAVDASAYEWEELWYEQTLDHFTAKDATFPMRYLFAQQWWEGPKSGAPIFMYCGNEGDIEMFAENTGFMWEIAPMFGALLVFPEHRYYGKSMPFGSEAAAYKDKDSLTYLTSEQALADFAVFITDLKKNLSAEASPVVLFGGSYGGMLASWMRLKYPHIAIGAIASSAPILQFEDLVSPYTFSDTVGKDFRDASESCYKTIKQSWAIFDKIGETKEGLHNLTQQFGVCKDLKSVGDLTEWVSSAYDYVSMINYPTPASFLQDLPAYPITEMCKLVDSVGGGSNGLAGIAAAMNLYYNYSGAYSCFDLSGTDGLGVNGWNWQACTEMVMPMSDRESTGLFSSYEWSFRDWENFCLDAYGVKPRQHWVVEEYGGRDIKAVLKHFGSNIVFSNGLVDPWSGGGVLETISESIVALVTEKGAHHLDLRAATPNDPDWLIEQRLAEVEYIMKWLAEYAADRASMPLMSY